MEASLRVHVAAQQEAAVPLAATLARHKQAALAGTSREVAHRSLAEQHVSASRPRPRPSPSSLARRGRLRSPRSPRGRLSFPQVWKLVGALFLPPPAEGGGEAGSADDRGRAERSTP